MQRQNNQPQLNHSLEKRKRLDAEQPSTISNSELDQKSDLLPPSQRKIVKIKRKIPGNNDEPSATTQGHDIEEQKSAENSFVNGQENKENANGSNMVHIRRSNVESQQIAKTEIKQRNKVEQLDEKSSETTEPQTRGQLKLLSRLPMPTQFKNESQSKPTNKTFEFKFEAKQLPKIAEKQKAVQIQKSEKKVRTIRGSKVQQRTFQKGNTHIMTRSMRKMQLSTESRQENNVTKKEQLVIVKSEPSGKEAVEKAQEDSNHIFQPVSVFLNPMSSSKALRDLRKSIHGVKGDANIFGLPLSSSPTKQIEFSTLQDNQQTKDMVHSFMNRNDKNKIQETKTVASQEDGQQQKNAFSMFQRREDTSMAPPRQINEAKNMFFNIGKKYQFNFSLKPQADAMYKEKMEKQTQKDAETKQQNPELNTTKRNPFLISVAKEKANGEEDKQNAKSPEENGDKKQPPLTFSFTFAKNPPGNPFTKNEPQKNQDMKEGENDENVRKQVADAPEKKQEAPVKPIFDFSNTFKIKKVNGAQQNAKQIQQEQSVDQSNYNADVSNNEINDHNDTFDKEYGEEETFVQPTAHSVKLFQGYVQQMEHLKVQKNCIRDGGLISIEQIPQKQMTYLVHRDYVGRKMFSGIIIPKLSKIKELPQSNGNNKDSADLKVAVYIPNPELTQTQSQEDQNEKSEQTENKLDEIEDKKMRQLVEEHLKLKILNLNPDQQQRGNESNSQSSSQLTNTLSKKDAFIQCFKSLIEN